MAKQLAPKTETYNDLVVTKNGYSYTLGESWALDDAGDFEFNIKSEDRAFLHGGYALGDRKVKSRTIKLEFDKVGATEAEFNDAVNTAYRYLSQTDYTLRSGRADRIYKIDGCKKMTFNFEKGFKQRRATVTVTLMLAENPFRLSTSQTTVTNTYAAAVTDEEITFNNAGSVDAPLIITVTPASGVTLSSIKLVHTESGEVMQIADSLLTNPAVLVVNGELGTVRRDSNNDINTFTGIFLHALPGNNHYMLTTNGACQFKIQYTARFFV